MKTHVTIGAGSTINITIDIPLHPPYQSLREIHDFLREVAAHYFYGMHMSEVTPWEIEKKLDPYLSLAYLLAQFNVKLLI